MIRAALLSGDRRSRETAPDASARSGAGAAAWRPPPQPVARAAASATSITRGPTARSYACRATPATGARITYLMPAGRTTESEAAQALVAVAPLATRWIERLLAAHDPPLTVPQYLALRAIAREEVSGAELARRTGVSGPAVSQILADLADAGLLRRPKIAGERRRTDLTHY